MATKKASRAQRWTFDAQVSGLRAFVDNLDQRMVSLEEPTDAVIRLLAKRPTRFRELMGAVNVHFDVIGGWWGSVGAVAVADGRDDGWVALRRGLHFQCFAAWIRQAWMTRDRCWDKEPVAASMMYRVEAHTLCHAIAMGHDAFARQFGQVLTDNFRRTGGGHKLFFYTESLQPFVFQLVNVWNRTVIHWPSDVTNPLGRYQSVVDGWDDVGRLKSAVADICELHCEQSYPAGDYPMFVYQPYNVFPVEILALARVRASRSEEMPVVPHRLLDTPLTRVPPEIPVVGDSLIGAVADYVRQAFPDVGEPW